MLKYAWAFAACLLGTQLSAETIGNVEFQFPPSNYEWKLLFDESFFQIALGEDEVIGEGLQEDREDYKMKIFTHREGDALELFVALQVATDEEDDEEETSLASAQKNLDEAFNQYFPHHRISLIQLTDMNGEGFAEWELIDPNSELFHCYARGLKKEGKTAVLVYFSTALKTEHNRVLWTQVLNDAR